MARVSAAEVFEARDIAEALKSDEVMREVLEFAEQVKTYWRSIAPVGDPKTDPHPGAYRDSIEVTRHGDNVFVVATDPKANLIEYGTHAGPHHGATPEFACRARTAAAFARGGDYGFAVLLKTPKRGAGYGFERVRAKYGVQATKPQPKRGRRRR